jgi:hypothetical protein
VIKGFNKVLMMLPQCENAAMNVMSRVDLKQFPHVHCAAALLIPLEHVIVDMTFLL